MLSTIIDAPIYSESHQKLARTASLNILNCCSLKGRIRKGDIESIMKNLSYLTMELGQCESKHTEEITHINISTESVTPVFDEVDNAIRHLCKGIQTASAGTVGVSELVNAIAALITARANANARF